MLTTRGVITGNGGAGVGAAQVLDAVFLSWKPDAWAWPNASAPAMPSASALKCGAMLRKAACVYSLRWTSVFWAFRGRLRGIGQAVRRRAPETPPDVRRRMHYSVGINLKLTTAPAAPGPAGSRPASARSQGMSVFVSLPSRQKAPLRWAMPLLFVLLWLCFLGLRLSCPTRSSNGLMLELGRAVRRAGRARGLAGLAAGRPGRCAWSPRCSCTPTGRTCWATWCSC